MVRIVPPNPGGQEIVRRLKVLIPRDARKQPPRVRIKVPRERLVDELVPQHVRIIGKLFCRELPEVNKVVQHAVVIVVQVLVGLGNGFAQQIGLPAAIAARSRQRPREGVPGTAFVDHPQRHPVVEAELARQPVLVHVQQGVDAMRCKACNDALDFLDVSQVENTRTRIHPSPHVSQTHDGRPCAFDETNLRFFRIVGEARKVPRKGLLYPVDPTQSSDHGMR